MRLFRPLDDSATRSLQLADPVEVVSDDSLDDVTEDPFFPCLPGAWSMLKAELEHPPIILSDVYSRVKILAPPPRRLFNVDGRKGEW